MKLESMPSLNEKHAVKELRETIILRGAKTAATNNATNQRATDNNWHNDKTANSVKDDVDIDGDTDEHHVSYVRVLKIPRAAPSLETYGFHLTRSKWDPYPWINAIDAGTPAAQCGLRAGDCVLEVNGKNVLGMRIVEIAKLVKDNTESVTLTLWTTSCQAKCNPESICCAPMPSTLQRLSAIVQSILSIIECPVCLETITPPAMQCQNGHLLCVNCRIRAEKCPVCRDHYTPRRSLIAEKIYATITSAFDLCQNEDKLRYKLFGRARLQQQLLRAQMQHNGNEQWPTLRNVTSVCATTLGRPRKARLPTNKFLTKLLHKKAYSMDNLTETNACTLMAANAMPENATVSKDNCRHSIDVCDAATLTTTMTLPATTTRKTATATSTAQSCSNQFHCWTNVRNHLTTTTSIDARQTEQQQQQAQSLTATRLTTAATMTLPKIVTTTTATTNNVAQSNGISKHYSLSSNDLQATQETQQQLLNEMPPTTQTLPRTTTTLTMSNNNDDNNSSSSSRQTAATATAANVSNSIDNNKNRMALFYLDKRRSCKSLSSSIECIRRSSLQHDLQMNKTTMATVATVRPFAVTCLNAGPELLSLQTTDAKILHNRTKANDCCQAMAMSLDKKVQQRMLTTTLQTQDSSTNAAASASIARPITTSLCVAAAKVQSNQPNLVLSCACPCNARLIDSAQLQHDVKVSHGLCVGDGGTTQLTLPLEHALLSLELNACKNVGAEKSGNKRTEKRNGTAKEKDVDDDDEANKNVVRDENEDDYEVARIKVRIETDKLSRECWISVKMQGRTANGNNTTAMNAIYEASRTERVNFAMTAFCAQQKQLKTGQLNENAAAAAAATC